MLPIYEQDVKFCILFFLEKWKDSMSKMSSGFFRIGDFILKLIFPDFAYRLFFLFAA